MDKTTSVKELRSFGLLVGGIVTVIGLWPVVRYGALPRTWAITVGGLLIAFGLFSPRMLAPIHRAWMWIGHVLGWINTRILLGIVFYGLITPLAIIFRVMGKDTMRQAFSENSPSYRVLRQRRSPSHMKYQF